MTRIPEAVVGEAYANSRAWDVLADLVEVGDRMAGQEGEKRGARVVADTMSYARDVRIEPFGVDGWWRGSSAVAVGEPHDRAFDRDHEVLALPGTVAGTVEAELVDVGYGLPERIGPEVDGKVVLARTDVPDDHDRWVHRLETYAAAVRNGAVGFLLRNHVPGALPPTGEVGWGRRPSPAPAAGVSAELGARLARYAAEGAPTVRLSVDCRTEPSTSVNVEGVVGPATEREVLVTAHVDAHDIADGARDNGVGCALVVEIGRLLARIEDDLETRVRLVTFGSEEVGLLGAEHLAATRDVEGIACVLNVDGAGESRTPSVRTYGYDGVAAAFEAVADDLDVPLERRAVHSPHTDAWPFAVRGVPAVTAGSRTEGDGRGWGHTHADTLEKIDSRDLRDLAVVYASVAAALANGDHGVAHADPAAYRDAVPAHVERELSFFDRWER
ncbi:MAG: M28 family peptidase [Haloferacaceae archaeon]